MTGMGQTHVPACAYSGKPGIILANHDNFKPSCRQADDENNSCSLRHEGQD
jgi:hypothetical protein